MFTLNQILKKKNKKHTHTQPKNEYILLRNLEVRIGDKILHFDKVHTA